MFFFLGNGGGDVLEIMQKCCGFMTQLFYLLFVYHTLFNIVRYFLKNLK